MVNEFLNPAGHPEIFVAGDLAHVEEDGHQIPGVAQPALQMGTHVARMIKQDLEEQAAEQSSTTSTREIWLPSADSLLSRKSNGPSRPTGQDSLRG